MEKIVLTDVQQTLLIPLYGKAMESQKDSPILVDKKAAEIVSKIDYNFSLLKIPKKTNLLMCLRARLIDQFVKSFLKGNSECVALHLGCGLDSRYDRIGNNEVTWYDVDFKEVMDIRELFYAETDKYHLISSSVTEDNWFQKVPRGKRHYIVVAEGLLMYLKEEDIKKVIRALKDWLGSFTLIFDAFSIYAAKKVGKHPSIKKTGAVIQWGIDDPVELTKWGMGLEFIKEQTFTSNDEIRNLNLGTRILFGMANLFPAVQKAHRLLIYKIKTD